MKTALLIALLFAITSAFGEPYITSTFSTDRATKESGPRMSGSGMQLGAGYRFGRFLGAEVSYVDSSGRADPMQQGASTVTRFWDASGPAISAVGTLPLGAFSIFAKVGVVRTEIETRELVTQGLSTLSDSRTTATSNESLATIGASLALGGGASVQAIASRFGDVRQYGVGLLYSF